jgi:hypothetical protein
MNVKRMMRLKSRGGGPEETRKIGGIKKEKTSGHQIHSMDGEDLGYFGSDKQVLANLLRELVAR